MNSLPDDPELAELLDQYLGRLQRGEQPDREALLRHHPGMASVLNCLEALESIAPASTGGDAPDTLALDRPSSPAVLPCEFGEYELTEEIGRGGMGVVYKARQTSLDRSVAVKMILDSHLASPEHVRRFKIEAKAAARLQHPNIVHIHEVGQVHGQHYFVMEYVEGRSLAERIEAGPVDVETGVRVLIQVARAVHHLHEHDIVHRDLKPSNILLDEHDQPFVTDFGLAKVFEKGSQETATGVITGTPSYMSPEQAAGRPSTIGRGSDVYSLGAILYELVAGRPPFREENPLDTLLQVLSREPTLPRELNRRVPRELELICLKCLAKAPEDRYPSAAALADDLEHFLRGEALVARPPNLGQRLRRWSRREPALATHLLVLAVFFLVEWGNYGFGIVNFAFHWKMLTLIGVWAVSSVALQQCLKVPRWAVPAQFLWGSLDMALLLAALFVADGAASALVVCFPMLVVGSALWFRVRFVSFMTGLSLLAYGVLALDYYCWRTELREAFPTRPDRHVIFAVMLVSVGAVVAYLVHRVRVLSTYYGQRP